MADFQYTRVLSHGRIESLARGYKTEYPFSIMELAPDAIPLDKYDVYWGAGNPKF